MVSFDWCGSRCWLCVCCFFFFKQKTAYEMRISDWSSDVCSSDLVWRAVAAIAAALDDLEEKAVAVIRAVDLEILARGIAVVEDVQIGRASCRERVCQYV